MLHQLIHVDAFIESLRLNISRIMNQLASHIFLSQNVSMILNVSGRGNAGGNLHQIIRPADLVDLSHLGQLVDQGHDIDRTLIHVHVTNGLVDLLMTRLIKRLGLENFRNHGKGIGIYHQSTQDNPFQVYGLRLDMSEIRINWSNMSLTSISLSIIWHNTILILFT